MLNLYTVLPVMVVLVPVVPWCTTVRTMAPRYQWYRGTTPGHAAEAYAAVKAAKYADQDNFVPFILETGGRVNKRRVTGSTL